MRCLRCGKCCLDTRMPLSKEDVERLARLGLRTEGFSYRRSGVTYLRNAKGRCVFLNDDLRCRVYRRRPLGCRLYPIVYDELRGVVPDNACPAWSTVTKRELEEAKLRLLKLIGEVYGSSL